jgi:hypothetical protein
MDEPVVTFGQPVVGAPPAENSGEFELENAKAALPILWRLADAIGFDSRKRIVVLLAVMFAPPVVLGLAAFFEGRFFLGSLTKTTTYGEALGMSYLGDSMVWPFSLLVPLMVLLVRYTTNRTVELLRSIYRQAGAAWRRDSSAAGLAETVRQTKLIIAGRGWLTSVVRRTAYVAAVLFWLYNSITCGVSPWLPAAAYPYRSSRVMILDANTKPDAPWLERFKNSKLVKTDEKLALPKWDCELTEAPVSCVLARAWTIVFYGAIPLVVAQLILLVSAAVFFLSRVAEWDRSHSRRSAVPALEIKPYAAGGFGGMEILARTGMSYMYAVSGFLVLAAMSFFKEGVPPAWHNYLLLVLALPIGLTIFIVPSAMVRDSISRAKERELEAIGERLNTLATMVIRAGRETSGSAAGVVRTHFQIQSLSALHERINNIPEWPFSISACVRISASLGLPVLMIAVEHWIGILVEKM